jgi:hypothetical protein
MDPDELRTDLTSRAAKFGAPLLAEIIDRAALDLHADERLLPRMLADFLVRMYSAGYRDGVAETVAQLIEQLPAEIEVDVGSPAPIQEGPLGEDPDFYEGTAGIG